MKHFAILVYDKNFATIFQLQWKIGNISGMFLQYSVLCGECIWNFVDKSNSITVWLKTPILRIANQHATLAGISQTIQHGRKLYVYRRFSCYATHNVGKVTYQPNSDECERDSWIFLDNFSTSFWWNSVIKIVRWFKLINSSNHLTIFLVEFRRKLVEKLSRRILRLCRPFTLP